MDNSILDMLSKLFMGGFNNMPSNFNNQNINSNNQNSNSQNNRPQFNNARDYYPNEAFQNNSINNESTNVESQSFNQNNFNMAENFNQNTSNQNNPFNQNNLLPMLLSMLGGNQNMSSISQLLSNLNGKSSNKQDNNNEIDKKNEGSFVSNPSDDEILL